MNLEYLNRNISEARRIIADIRRLKSSLKSVDKKEERFYLQSISSLYAKLRIINDSIPELLLDISAAKKLDSHSVKSDAPLSGRSNIAVLSYRSPTTQTESLVALKKEDKEKFIKELSISDQNIQKISQIRKENILLKPSKYVAVSNKFFGRFSEKITYGRFGGLKDDLRQSNSKFLVASYISVTLFSSLLVFLVSVLLLSLVVFFFRSAWVFFLISLVPPMISLVIFYLAPTLEKSNVEKGVGNELPFASIYMAAIASSNVEPTRIFRIISNSEEYKYIGFEMRKIMNQVEVYGYDLVTALRSVAFSTSNKRLGELLNGMASNIVSGGSLKVFLEKKSETLLNDYRLEREKYNSVAATFMDVYISILITAPLILVMLIVVMGITGLGLGGISVGNMVIIAIGIVILVNIFFLIFLQIRQPKV